MGIGLIGKVSEIMGGASDHCCSGGEGLRQVTISMVHMQGWGTAKAVPQLLNSYASGKYSHRC